MIVIEDIFWERVNLHLIFSENLEGYRLYLDDEGRRLELKPDKKELVINVTNTPGGQMLNPAEWRLIMVKNADKTQDSETVSSVSVSPELLKQLDDKSRIFRYRAGKCAYLVDFRAKEQEGFFIRTDFMSKNRNWKSFYQLREETSWTGKLIVLLKKAYLAAINLDYRLMRLFKHNTKKNVLFFTENSDELTGNLKMLYDSVPEDSCHKLSYANDTFSSTNAGFFHKIGTTLKGIYLLAQSDVIFVDNYVPKLTHITLNEKTRLIQLWHAGVGFKSVGYARFGLPGSPHPYHSCHRNYTDVIVDRENLIEVYQEVFGVRREVFKALGMPRLDGYMTREKIERTAKKLYAVNENLAKKKVILFSPTFRGTGSRDAWYDYSLLKLEQLYMFCKEHEFLFVIKMHPFIEKRMEIPKKYADVILDYSKFEINDLIYVSDIMVTDYSSCAYEFSLFDRPLIFFRPDKEQYEYDRPMHTLKIFSRQQFEVRTMKEMLEILKQFVQIDVSARLERIRTEEGRNTCEEIRKQFIE